MKKQLYLLIMIWLSGVVHSFAQPTNDNLVDVIEVTTIPFADVVTAMQSNNATIETDEVTCGINQTWWYRYTPTEEQLIRVKVEMNNATTGQIANEVRLGFYMDLDNDNAHPLQEIMCFDNNNGAGFGENELMTFEANMTYYIQVSTSALVDAQDDITFMMIPLVVPVELTLFNGKAVENGIQLNWETASEQNNAGFDVQHSLNAKEWRKLNFIAGKGTTVAPQQYSYLDNTVKEGKNYYRLQQIDLDGQSEYSHVIQVNYTNPWKATVFPNPTTGQLTIRTRTQKTPQLQLTNLLGQSVVEPTDDTHELDISHLPNGIYWLTIQSNIQKQTHLIRLQK